jgi:hypothetical protein
VKEEILLILRIFYQAVMVVMHNPIRNKDVDKAIKRLEEIQNQQEES